MPPTFGNGKICYIEIPATDIARSASFYGQVAGWRVRPPAAEPGLMVHVMVDSVSATLEAIVAKGGEIGQPIGADAPEITRGSAIRQET
jgi:uncharacterized protein